MLYTTYTNYMEQHYTLEEIKSWERFYRANFMNSLSGFKSASLIGTVNEKGITNLAIFSNIVHLGADPALVGFINRPLAAAPHTISNIEKTGCFTINLICEEMISLAHQTSAKYEEGVSEFDATGFTPQYSESCIAPFVKESKIKYCADLKEIIPIKYNNTFFVIGAIKEVIIDTSILNPDGFLSLEEAETITSLGLDAYYRAQLVARYAYAKPDLPPRKINN